MRIKTLAARVALSIALVPLGGFAQTPTPPTPLGATSDNEITMAREQFRAGVAAVRASQWDVALTAFQRSYALYPQPLTLLNIAGAQVETGRLVAGAESYRRFLAQATTGPASTHRQEATEALERTERRVAHAALDVVGLESGDLILLDAQPLGRAAVGMSIPIDPGAHVFTVQRAQTEAARVALTFAPGDLQRVTLAVHARALVGLDPVGQTEPPRRRGGVLRSPWFWTVAGVVVIGAAVTTVVLATQSDPVGYSGNFMPGRVTVQ